MPPSAGNNDSVLIRDSLLQTLLIALKSADDDHELVISCWDNLQETFRAPTIRTSDQAAACPRAWVQNALDDTGLYQKLCNTIQRNQATKVHSFPRKIASRIRKLAVTWSVEVFVLCDCFGIEALQSERFVASLSAISTVLPMRAAKIRLSEIRDEKLAQRKVKRQRKVAKKDRSRYRPEDAAVLLAELGLPLSRKRTTNMSAANGQANTEVDDYGGDPNDNNLTSPEHHADEEPHDHIDSDNDEHTQLKAQTDKDHDADQEYFDNGIGDASDNDSGDDWGNDDWDLGKELTSSTPKTDILTDQDILADQDSLSDNGKDAQEPLKELQHIRTPSYSDKQHISQTTSSSSTQSTEFMQYLSANTTTLQPLPNTGAPSVDINTANSLFTIGSRGRDRKRILRSRSVDALLWPKRQKLSALDLDVELCRAYDADQQMDISDFDISRTTGLRNSGYFPATPMSLSRSNSIYQASYLQDLVDDERLEDYNWHRGISYKRKGIFDEEYAGDNVTPICTRTGTTASLLKLNGASLNKKSPAYDASPGLAHIAGRQIENTTASVFQLNGTLLNRNPLIHQTSKDSAHTTQDLVQCKIKASASLVPGQKLRDDVIMFGILSFCCEDFYIFDPLLFNKQTQQNPRRDFDRVHFGGRAEFWLIPIHSEVGGHWALVLVDRKRGVISYFDSYPLPGCFQQAVTKLKTWFGNGQYNLVSEEWEFRQCSVPHQDNSVDCGVHVIANAVYIMAGLHTFPDIDVKHWRKVLAWMLTDLSGEAVDHAATVTCDSTNLDAFHENLSLTVSTYKSGLTESLSSFYSVSKICNEVDVSIKDALREVNKKTEELELAMASLERAQLELEQLPSYLIPPGLLSPQAYFEGIKNSHRSERRNLATRTVLLGGDFILTTLSKYRSNIHDSVEKVRSEIAKVASSISNLVEKCNGTLEDIAKNI